jgi:hypothetical protein
MKKIPQIESQIIVEKFLKKIESSVRSAQAESIIEYFELEIDDQRYEICFCAYLQTPDQNEAILFETTLGRFFYLKTETVEAGSQVRAIPNLYVLDPSVSTTIPKRIRDKMQTVTTSRISETVELEDFAVKFRLFKPR